MCITALQVSNSNDNAIKLLPARMTYFSFIQGQDMKVHIII